MKASQEDLSHIMDSIDKMNPKTMHDIVEEAIRKAVQKMYNQLANDIFTNGGLFHQWKENKLQSFDGGQFLQQPFVIDPK
jgi:hypothetical protein